MANPRQLPSRYFTRDQPICDGLREPYRRHEGLVFDVSAKEGYRYSILFDVPGWVYRQESPLAGVRYVVEKKILGRRVDFTYLLSGLRVTSNQTTILVTA